MDRPFPAYCGDIPVHLFFALLPPPDVCPAIDRLGMTLQRAHRLGGQRIGKAQQHATLASLYHPWHNSGGPLTETIARARSVAADVQHPPFPLSFEWSESFRLHRRRHPLVLRGDQGLRALIGFRHEIRARMTRAGFAVTPSFTPHLTLLWADDCVEAHPLAPIGWTARDFALVLSLVGLSRHIHLARWPLQ